MNGPGTPAPVGGKAPPPMVPVPPPGGWLNPSEAPMHHKAVLMVAPITAFYILGLIALGLRVYARYIKKASWRLSDYAIFIAAACGTGYLAVIWLMATRGGIGYPIVMVALPERLLIRKSTHAAWILQCWANSFVRLSILDFLIQVFRPVKRFRVAVYMFQGATVAYLVACTIAWFATCRPFKYNWELGPAVPLHCGNLKMKFLLSAVFNLVLDVGILLLPMPVLWTLHVTTRKKFAISFVFGLGAFVCFATAWRLYHVVEFSKPKNQMNFTVGVVEDALWSGLEITLGIINACLPVIQPAAQSLVHAPYLRLVSSFSSSRFSKRSKGSSGYNSTSDHSRFTPWSLNSSKSRSKSGIIREVEYTIDAESNHEGRIPLGSMESTRRLAPEESTPYHDPLTNKLRNGDTAHRNA